MDLQTIADTLKCFVRNGSSGALFVVTFCGLLIAAIIVNLIVASFDSWAKDPQFLTGVTLTASGGLVWMLGKWLRELYRRRRE